MTAAVIVIVPGPPESVTMTVTAPLRHQCPFVNETDEGSVTLTWTTSGNTLELHALRGYLDQFADWVISHEELTDKIRDDLGAVQGIYAVQVETRWSTAGMGVTCSTWETPAKVRP